MMRALQHRLSFAYTLSHRVGLTRARVPRRQSLKIDIRTELDPTRLISFTSCALDHLGDPQSDGDEDVSEGELQGIFQSLS